jgi:hypothetical protein
MKSKLVAHEVNRQLCKVTDMFLAHMFGEIDTLPDDNNIYRVSMKHSPYIEVMCLGDGFVDSACDGMYYGGYQFARTARTDLGNLRPVYANQEA